MYYTYLFSIKGAFLHYTINYSLVLIFILFLLLVVLFILFFFVSLANEKYSGESLSSYECGFLPLDESAVVFDIQFYLVAISFLLFDLEIVLIVPVILVMKELEIGNCCLFFFFIFLVTAGFILEWIYSKAFKFSI